MIKLSTGMRNGILAYNSFKGALDGGLLAIFGGTVPSSADDATSGATLLVTISLSGGGSGINFEASAVSGVLSKAAAETWQGTIGTGGTATFFRFYESGGDPTAASTTEQRIQGTVGVAGADLNLSSLTLVGAAIQTLDYFNVTLPASA